MVMGGGAEEVEEVGLGRMVAVGVEVPAVRESQKSPPDVKRGGARR